ncbi:50S ribosomal protein L11 methyltransferase [Flavihumibacter rivuli]|uniref:50S ribosomal protein L11 methyltransferase n=1 Tax=Flavihumibacter rivuli TaxID=2838156 RepID=UPI001BDEB130|nr:50S ribosomal protein L11 methyltransferase [Flavihumibacter rivuli]ULQ57476.1 50S ribosomal protein L11 methyltransferase [Flavihumibacter rivuli]
MEYYQQVSITVSNTETREILVALLADAGYEGFVEEPGILKAFIAESAFDQQVLDQLVQPFAQAYELERIMQRNWNAEWESQFQPVAVGDFCAVRADFHEPIKGVRHDIIVTPKMSFGTGHHATTYMMLEAMQEEDFNEKKVLDFGTGTGVLAILAAKLGASTVKAIDNDSWSIENALENFERNSVNGQVDLEKADTITGEEQYDIILANINKNVIISQLDIICKHLRPNGVLIISGLLQSDTPDLQKAIALHGLSLLHSFERNSWICWKLGVKV